MTQTMPDPILAVYLAPVFERKAAEVTAIDVRDLTSYADTIIIVEATSRRQVTSLAEHVVKRLKQDKTHLYGKEGIKDGEWALLDYGDVIIHIFESTARSFFNLDGLWADAPRIDLCQYTQTNSSGDTDDA
jgi:ribosome-associated protein